MSYRPQMINASDLRGQKAGRDLASQRFARASQPVAVGRGADGPDPGRREVIVKELEDGTRLERRSLLHDGLSQCGVAVHEHLQNH